MNAPEPREIRMMERSLSAFRNGLVGLLPVIGGPWALAAIRSYIHARAAGGGLWNPAGRYAFVGLLLGWAGMLWFAAQVLAVAMIALSVGS